MEISGRKGMCTLPLRGKYLVFIYVNIYLCILLHRSQSGRDREITRLAFVEDERNWNHSGFHLN
jgi:hypothetical protein